MNVQRIGDEVIVLGSLTDWCKLADRGHWWARLVALLGLEFGWHD